MTGNPIAPTTTATNASPNDLLASQIADSLVTAGLIKDGHKATLLAKLKSGGVTQDDWNLWIDVATSPQQQQGGTGND